MITDGAVWHHVNGTDTVTFNDATSPYTIRNFDVSVEMVVNKDRKKRQKPGMWPTRTFEGGMEIHMEGDILAEDSDDYNTKRIALIKGLKGPPDVAVTDYKIGTLSVDFDGQTEVWDVDCTIEAISAVLDAASPARSAYMVTFYAFQPWFIGHTTPSNKYQYA